MDKDKRGYKQFGFFVIHKEERTPGDFDSDMTDFCEQYMINAIRMISDDIRRDRGEIAIISDVKNIPKRRARVIVEHLKLDVMVRKLREEARSAMQKISKV